MFNARLRASPSVRRRGYTIPLLTYSAYSTPRSSLHCQPSPQDLDCSPQMLTGQARLRAIPEHIGFAEASAASNKDLSVHRWTNWIAGFSGGFVTSAIAQYMPFPPKHSLIVDPFAGVGTTLVEAYRAGTDCVGFELNPFPALVARVKLESVKVDTTDLRAAIDRYRHVMDSVEEVIDRSNDLSSFPTPRSVAPSGFISRIPFFSEKVQTKVLHTRDFILDLPQPLADLFSVALASVIVGLSNYSYEPSLSSRPAAGKALLGNAPVGPTVSTKLYQMADDIDELQAGTAHHRSEPRWAVHCTSYFNSASVIVPGSVDLVVTSPPYLNNYHYVRNTRPQLFWSELVGSSRDLKRLEEENFGKYWQTVRARDLIQLSFLMPGLSCQIERIRDRNSHKGIYGGTGWANYITSYMNDLFRFSALLAQQLRPRTGVAVVVLGDSVIQGEPLPVERYFSEIALLHGLKTEGIFELRSRTGSSIVNTGLRTPGAQKYRLCDFAVVLRRSD